MVFTAEIKNVDMPAKAVIGEDTKIQFTVSIRDGPMLGSTYFTFLIDKAHPETCLKGEKTGILGADEDDDEDITFTMPETELLECYLELWTEVPAKYDGKCDIEGWV